MRTLRPALLLVCALAHGVSRGGSWESTFAVPDGLPATFEIPFPVVNPGQVVVEASWAGPRLLFFGVLGPHEESLSRRSGPSPQSLKIEADATRAGVGAVWTLTIKALVARGAAEGRVTITVPDAPALVALREAARRPKPTPPPPPPEWMVPRSPPAGSSTEVADVFRAVETFRHAVGASTSGPQDACAWQLDLLQYAAAARNRLGELGATPDVPSLRYFGRLAAAIRTVDGLKTSKDRVLAGPIPSDRNARRDWLIEHNERVRPIERRLDELTELLRGGHAPSLEEETWVPRLSACLTACERFFDDRMRLGSADIAPNRELAEAQWDRILAAAAMLESFAPFLKEPREPDRDVAADR